MGKNRKPSHGRSDLSEQRRGSESVHNNKYEEDNCFSPMLDSTEPQATKGRPLPGRRKSLVERLTKRKMSMQMKKSISLMQVTASLIAVTGHTAIFITPSSILENTGALGLSLIIWLFGGIINWMQALIFVEFGTSLDEAGGTYSYVRAACGPLAGFMMLWSYMMLSTGPFWSFLGYTAAMYSVKPVFPDCPPPEGLVKLLAAILILLLAFLNCFCKKLVSKIQIYLSATKIIALLVIIAGGAVRAYQGHTENIVPIFENRITDPGPLALSILYSVFAFGGWQVVMSLVEEMEDPAKDLPRGVTITFIVTITKYILTLLAYMTLLTKHEVLQSNAVALLYIQRLYHPLTIMISACVAFTSVGALNASVMGHSRVLFAAARHKAAPLLFGMLHIKYLTPWPSIWVLCAWSLVVLYSGGMDFLLDLVSFISCLVALVIAVALIYYKIKQPNVKRPYKVPMWMPVSHALFFSAVLALGIYQKPNQMLAGVVISLLGYPIYLLGICWQPKPRAFTKKMEYITVTCQKLLNLRKSV
ncbi:cystine/glutamate transporter-like isoform X1 [Octopus sinensis]|uniref:Cystine/glutamate transporter-like isoform X1 n=1 Tax=Octopus sinensis TaxID=2607531 RepID=A0A7E6FFU4_9MOLL|nr:cystine/glutamate transporter-like isoform X1 [Octopus sinensis]